MIGTVSAFWMSAKHDDGHYAAFLISFAVIAAAWSDHHELFAYARRVDTRLRVLNTWWSPGGGGRYELLVAEGDRLTAGRSPIACRFVPS